jgi:integrase
MSIYLALLAIRSAFPASEGGSIGVPSALTIWGHYRTFLLVELERRPATVYDYRKILFLFWAFLGQGAKPKGWHQATRKDLTRFLQRPSQANSPNPGHLSANSRKHYGAAVRCFYRWAHVHEYLPKDRMASFTLPRAGQARPRSLSREDLAVVLEAAEFDPRLACVCWLAYGQGMRAAEIAAVRLEDIDLGRRPTLLVHGKGGRPRVLPVVNSEVQAAIRRLLVDRRERVGPLVCSRTVPGSPLSPHTISSMLSRFIRSQTKADGSGPIDASGHGLRHSFTEFLLEEAGEDKLVTISRLLGHRSTSVTETVYALRYRGDQAGVLGYLPVPTRRTVKQ